MYTHAHARQPADEGVALAVLFRVAALHQPHGQRSFTGLQYIAKVGSTSTKALPPAVPEQLLALTPYLATDAPVPQPLSPPPSREGPWPSYSPKWRG